MFNGSDSASFVALRQNKNYVDSIEGSSWLTSDVFEITSVKSDGSEIKIVNASSTCAANISFIAPALPKDSRTKHACSHQDSDSKEFVYNKGCYVDQVIDISDTQ
jgi:hypothetical protein